MITKKFLTKVLLCVVVFHFIGLGRGQSVPVTMQEPLSMAMQATGAEVSKARIIGNGKLAVDDDTIEGLKKIVEKSAGMLGIEKGNYEIEERPEGTRLGVGLFSGGENTRIMIWARGAKNADEKKDVELTIKIVDMTPIEENIAKREALIYAVLQNFAAAPRISTCLEGYLDGRLRKDVWAIHLRDAFDAIGADIHTTTDGGAYMSYTGYSPVIRNKGIVVGGDKVNINMAVRYHSFDRRTYFVIGSPVIAVEY